MENGNRHLAGHLPLNYINIFSIWKTVDSNHATSVEDFIDYFNCRSYYGLYFDTQSAKTVSQVVK